MTESLRQSRTILEKTLAKSPAFRKVDTNFYLVRQGSAYIYIQILPTTEDRALVRFVSQLVSGVEMTPDLAIKLLRMNARMRFGAFGYVREGSCITFSHTLLGGATLDAEEVLATLRDVALISDEYDDRIIEEFGGQTMQQLIEESANESLKEHIEDENWHKL
jgi:Putative bacterial sensory transduction regulator